MRQQREQHVVVQFGASTPAIRGRSWYLKYFIYNALCDKIFTEGGVQELIGSLWADSCLRIVQGSGLWSVNEEELSDDPLSNFKPRLPFQKTRFEHFDILTELRLADILPSPVEHS